MNVERNAQNDGQFGIHLKHILRKSRSMPLAVNHRSVTAESRV